MCEGTRGDPAMILVRAADLPAALCDEEGSLVNRELFNQLCDQAQAEKRARARVVYYVRAGRIVKIGCTTDMVERMRALIPDEVLATEPGSFDLERQRHHEFRHLALGGELFTLAPDLREHIDRLRAEHGAPDQSRYRTTDKWIGRLTTREAARFAGVEPATIRSWRHRGKLTPAALDHDGNPLYEPAEVRAAAAGATRRRGQDVELLTTECGNCNTQAQ